MEAATTTVRDLTHISYPFAETDDTVFSNDMIDNVRKNGTPGKAWLPGDEDTKFVLTGDVKSESMEAISLANVSQRLCPLWKLSSLTSYQVLAYFCKSVASLAQLPIEMN